MIQNHLAFGFQITSEKKLFKGAQSSNPGDLLYSASQKKRNDCHVRKNGAEKRPEKVAHKSFTGEFCDSLAFVYDRLVSLTENLKLLGLQNLTAMPLRSKLKRSTI